MPKGEHFKKENPRIHQVSFKVNKSELAILQCKVKDAGMSIPEWIRQFINAETVIIPNTKTKSKKAKGPKDGVHRGRQTSLF